MEITTDQLVRFLASVPGFRDLTQEDLKQKIAPIVGIVHYDPGQTILRQGDPPRMLYILYSGRVHGTTVSAEKKEHHFFIDEGNVFGEAALVTNRRRASTVRAAAPTLCLTLDIDTFQQIMIQDWPFAKAFFTLVGQRVVDRLIRTEIIHYPWLEKYRIGLPDVDGQHQRLFNLINQLGQFLEGNQDDPSWNVQEFFMEIMDYVEKHFHDEEELMAQHAVPWLDAHQKIHRGFTATVVEVRNKALSASHEDERIYLLEQVHKLLGNWLIKHILREDTKFGTYYREKNHAHDLHPQGGSAENTGSAENALEQP